MSPEQKAIELGGEVAHDADGAVAIFEKSTEAAAFRDWCNHTSGVSSSDVCTLATGWLVGYWVEED